MKNWKLTIELETDGEQSVGAFQQAIEEMRALLGRHGIRMRGPAVRERLASRSAR